MNTEPHFIEVGGIQVEIVRKAIKHLRLGVYPPSGRVRVAAPLRVADAAVRTLVMDKIGWIRRHQSRFAGQPRPSRHAMVTGEHHYFRGERYPLQVIEQKAPPKVVLNGNATLELYVRPDTDAVTKSASR